MVLDEFAVPNSTLPIVVNQGYNSRLERPRDSRRVPAAAVLRHQGGSGRQGCRHGRGNRDELTHGFDSQGRQYDAKGNVHNWWTQADANRFVAEAGKLAKQADAFEILPGLHLNGAMKGLTENLADVGGVAIRLRGAAGAPARAPGGQSARSTASRRRSAASSRGDGYGRPAKVNDGALRQGLPIDGHPPGRVPDGRPVAQHEKAFLGCVRHPRRRWHVAEPNDRVTIW